MSVQKIGFIGAGKMATALAKGVINSGFAAAEDLLASDSFADSRSAFEKQTGSQTTENNLDVLKAADVVILAVKPQVLGDVLTELSKEATAEHLFVSIVAGAKLETLQRAIPESRHVRVMPNTPAIVQLGAAGFSCGTKATSDDATFVQEMLETVGLALNVPEHLLDVVTGLSGSGPAYVFEMIEALSDGAVLMGLPRAAATQLAAQTLLGAAKMVLETGEHPGALKDAVTSPGGTTIAGLHQLERGGLRGILMNAVQAATEKSKELGQKS